MTLHKTQCDSPPKDKSPEEISPPLNIDERFAIHLITQPQLFPFC